MRDAAAVGRDTVPDEAARRDGGPPIIIRPWQRRGYLETVEAMRGFTLARDAATPDEIWLVEHERVLTLGHAADPAHLLAPGDIPVVRAERGGQVTYHGPGQVVAYVLVDLHRRRLKVHRFICLLEQAVIDVLARHHVRAARRDSAPGVYLSSEDGAPGAKIASVGIRVSQGRTWHGLALNVDMNLEPFSRIDPCGFPGLEVTDLRSQTGAASPQAVATMLGDTLAHLIEACP